MVLENNDLPEWVPVDRPFMAFLGVVTVVLALDLVAKVVGIDVGFIGGNLAFSRLLTLLWDGFVVGLSIGLAGVGLSITYSILNFANFAHGDYISTGAFAGWSVTFLIAGLTTGQFADNFGYLATTGFGEGPSAADLNINFLGQPFAIIIGLLIAIVTTVAVTLLVDRVVYKPMRDEGGITLLIASVGVALALRYLIVFVYGSRTRGLTAGGQQAEILGVTISSQEVVLVVLALGLMLLLHLVLQRTKLGKAMRAMADNEDLARVTGIPSERVIRLTWIIGGGMAGAAGYLYVLERGTLAFNVGWLLLLLIFAAVILGGIGSIYGAMVGGVVIGITQTLSLVWIPTAFATPAAFSIMIVMLVVKPDGLFGGVTTA